MTFKTVDPEKTAQGILDEPLEFGHIAAIVGTCSSKNKKFKFKRNSLVSKTRKSGFEDQSKFLEEKLISSKSEKEPRSLKYPVKEFYIVLDPEALKINIANYLERLSKAVDEASPWDALYDSCGHAFYKVFTGEDLGAAKSAQTAFMYTMAYLTSANPELTDHFLKGIMLLKIDKTGHEVGKALIEYKNKERSPIEELDSQSENLVTKKT